MKTSRLRLALCQLWMIAILIGLFPLAAYMGSSLPIFTILWLLPVLIVLSVKKDAQCVGLGPIALRTLLTTAALALGGLLLVAVLVEPWSRAYTQLVRMALSAAQPDLTFIWLARIPGAGGFAVMLLFSGLVSLFAEELFFRGWLLQALAARLGLRWAVLLQALAFALPNGLAAWVLPAPAGWAYLIAYTFLGVGLINGWAAAKTGTIWPGLLAATLSNLVLCWIAVG